MKPAKVTYSLQSVSPEGVSLRTVAVRYWRGIHAEALTHRDLSRSASSSRAVPVKTMLKQVWKDPAGPLHWGKNRPGMQADEQLTGWRLWAAKALWRSAAKFAALHSWAMMKVGAHKQVANRPTEPFQYIHVVFTGSRWNNFDALRRHADAQPEIKDLAEAIKENFDTAPVQKLNRGQWHLPFIRWTSDKKKVEEHYGRVLEQHELLEVFRKLSAARCARTSYMKHDGADPDVVSDLELVDQLFSTPMHASPFEHQATPDRLVNKEWRRDDLHGNLKGWIQSRKLLPNERSPESWE